jgi:Cu+-exporting ATPase
MRISVVLFLVLISFVCVSLVFSGTEEEHPAVISIEETTAPVYIGNKYCPVSGEEISEENRVTHEYEGKTYNFCSQECIEEFENNPEEYIEIVEEELRTQGEKEFNRQSQDRLKEPEPVSSYHEEHLY